MLFENLAMLTAALFTGAAIYINVAEQPARLALNDGAMLTQWQASYRRASRMQGGLALVGSLLGFAAFLFTEDWLWIAGGLVLLSAWPFTLIVIKPTNDALNAARPEPPTAETRQLVEKWGRLHAGRSAIGAAATLLYLLTSS
jgi:hypothetical protein